MTKQAILIIAHNHPAQLHKLLRALDSEYFDIFLHIGKDSKLRATDFIPDCTISKLHIYKKLRVRWSGYSQVRAEVFLLKQATKADHYGHYHLISGADMPIKTPRQIYDFFNSHKNNEFISFQQKTILPEHLDWIRYYYIFRQHSRNSRIAFHLENLSVKIQEKLHINRLRNDTTTYMKGTNWFSITDAFARYVVEHSDSLKHKYKLSKSADEIFLHTLLFNSPFRNNLYSAKYNDSQSACMRHIDWKRGDPYIFRSSDYEELIHSKNMFARKFDETIDAAIIDKIYNYVKRPEGTNAKMA